MYYGNRSLQELVPYFPLYSGGDSGLWTKRRLTNNCELFAIWHTIEKNVTRKDRKNKHVLMLLPVHVSDQPISAVIYMRRPPMSVHLHGDLTVAVIAAQHHTTHYSSSVRVHP